MKNELSSQDLKIDEEEYKVIWEYFTLKDLPKSAIQEFLDLEGIAMDAKNFPEYFTKLEENVIKLKETNKDVEKYINRFELTEKLRENNKIIDSLNLNLDKMKKKLEIFLKKSLNIIYPAVKEYKFEIEEDCIPTTDYNVQTMIFTYENLPGIMLFSKDKRKNDIMRMVFRTKSEVEEEKLFKRRVKKEIFPPEGEYFVDVQPFFHIKSDLYTYKEFIDKVVESSKRDSEGLNLFVKSLSYVEQKAKKYLNKKEQFFSETIKELTENESL